MFAKELEWRMCYSSILDKMSVFVQLFSQIQTNSNYFCETLESQFGKFHKISFFRVNSWKFYPGQKKVPFVTNLPSWKSYDWLVSRFMITINIVCFAVRNPEDSKRAMLGMCYILDPDLSLPNKVTAIIIIIPANIVLTIITIMKGIESKTLFSLLDYFFLDIFPKYDTSNT